MWIMKTEVKQENNLQIYDNKRKERIILFVFRQSLLLLQNSEDWFVHGTFSTVPLQFLQLFTVHVNHHVRNVVGTLKCCCLLRNKHRKTIPKCLGS